MMSDKFIADVLTMDKNKHMNRTFYGMEAVVQSETNADSTEEEHE